MSISESILALSKGEFKRRINLQDVVSNGKILKAGAIRQKDLKCSICRKPFKLGKQLNYFYSKMADFYLMCDSCLKWFNEEWTVVELIDITPDDIAGLSGLATLKFADGSVRSIPYNSGKMPSGLELPPVFFESFAPFQKRYWEEQKARKCTNVEVNDDWNSQQIIATFGDKRKYIINFKLGTNSRLIYNPDDVQKVSKDELIEINKALKERNIPHYIHINERTDK